MPPPAMAMVKGLVVGVVMMGDWGGGERGRALLGKAMSKTISWRMYLPLRRSEDINSFIM